MDRRKDGGGGRERVEKRIREKRESVFISREREREFTREAAQTDGSF